MKWFPFVGEIESAVGFAENLPIEEDDKVGDAGVIDKVL